MHIPPTSRKDWSYYQAELIASSSVRPHQLTRSSVWALVTLLCSYSFMCLLLSLASKPPAAGKLLKKLYLFHLYISAPLPFSPECEIVPSTQETCNKFSLNVWCVVLKSLCSSPCRNADHSSLHPVKNQEGYREAPSSTEIAFASHFNRKPVQIGNSTWPAWV